MLTESDPRRANWLTITSMSEDLCWPEENSTSRPNWELEAEILRLTTRLMMRERELRQAKSQAGKSQQQAAGWRKRMQEKEEQMKELLLQKDAEMQSIVSQLLLFEAELRQEQGRIEGLLREKDALIRSQKQELERLRSSSSSSEVVEVRKIRAIQDVTNVKNLDDSGPKRIPYKAPQKMKDLKAKRINTHKVPAVL